LVNKEVKIIRNEKRHHPAVRSKTKSESKGIIFPFIKGQGLNEKGANSLSAEKLWNERKENLKGVFS